MGGLGVGEGVGAGSGVEVAMDGGVGEGVGVGGGMDVGTGDGVDVGEGVGIRVEIAAGFGVGTGGSLCWYNCWGCCRRRRRCGTRLSCRCWDGCWLWSLVFAGAGSYEQYDDCRGQQTQEVTVFLYSFGKTGQLGILKYRTVHKCGTIVPRSLHHLLGHCQRRLSLSLQPRVRMFGCLEGGALS